MWRTPTGNRVITGKFKKMFAYGVASMLEWMFNEKTITNKKILSAVFDEDYKATGPEEDYILHHDFFHEPFRSFTLKDKLMAVATVTKALFDKKTPCPELQQYNESAVYAVFEAVTTEIQIEIDVEKDKIDSEFTYYARKLVSDAEQEVCKYERDDDFIKVTCAKIEDWRCLVDGLSEQILWDMDFLDTDLADADPEIAAYVKQTMGIDPNYYTGVMPPYTKQEFLVAMAYLHRVIKKCVPECVPA